MIIYEKKMVQKNESVAKEILCDECGRKENVKNQHHEKPLHWFGLLTGHHSWGNDSAESIERFDMCSVKCLLDVVKRKRKENYYNTSYLFSFLLIPNFPIMDIEELSNENVDELLETFREVVR